MIILFIKSNVSDEIEISVIKRVLLRGIGIITISNQHSIHLFARVSSNDDEWRCYHFHFHISMVVVSSSFILDLILNDTTRL